MVGPDAPGGQNTVKALLWLGAVIFSLPMFIAAVRKLEAHRRCCFQK